ncbi:hypothetical protein TR51_05510 [Kitasatospora griseola]|uniref:Uncharacterized protein n=1 Tax=Kitasatospora griseola TaxID=2064 RepID=A0A0D0Q2V1_KITGR|nr:hypothetical protein TR51_05510 [Kitasatospora griseola]
MPIRPVPAVGPWGTGVPALGPVEQPRRAARTGSRRGRHSRSGGGSRPGNSSRFSASNADHRLASCSTWS